jgi:GntR family histidine utilization transcriptional repressor
VAKTGGKETTLHQTILSEIEGRIVSGEWPPGHRLPFEVNLAEHYGCSRMTVNKVMTQLAKAGLIERHRKVGSFVTTPRAQSAVLELHDIETEVKSLGLAYSHELLLRTQRKAAKDDAKLIDVAKSTPLVEVLAVHRAGGLPFCVEERLINIAVVPEAETTDFAQHAPGGWLIAQVPWTTAENHIQAVAASAEIARLLGIAKGTACLVVERRTWSHAGPVTFVRLTYPGERHSLIARFMPAQG